MRISPRARHVASIVLVVGVVVFSWFALRDSWADVAETIRRLEAIDLAIAFILGIAASVAAYRSWLSVLRSLSPVEMSHHDARAMYFCSLPGKYVPGSVWPALIQTELGARNKIPRSVVVLSYATALAITLASAAVFSGLALVDPRSTTMALASAGALVGGVLLTVGLLHGSGANRLVTWLVSRRVAPSERDPITLHPRHTTSSLLWSLLYWLLLSIQATAIAVVIAPNTIDARSALLVAGALALSWLCGLLALPLPAGAGVREAVFAFALSPLIGRPTAIGLALVTRFVAVIGDLGLAAVSGLPGLLKSMRSKNGVNGNTSRSEATK